MPLLSPVIGVEVTLPTVVELGEPPLMYGVTT